MKALPNNSVHLDAISPLYWRLKDYGAENPIRFDDSYENYISNLNLVCKACYRVLHNGSKLCINIGGQFAHSIYYGRYIVIPIREEIIKFCEVIGFNYNRKFTLANGNCCDSLEFKHLHLSRFYKTS